MRNYWQLGIGGLKRTMKIKEIQTKIASLEERTTTLEIELTKIRDLLKDVLSRWPIVQELLHQLTSGYLRDR